MDLQAAKASSERRQLSVRTVALLFFGLTAVLLVVSLTSSAKAVSTEPVIGQLHRATAG